MRSDVTLEEFGQVALARFALKCAQEYLRWGRLSGNPCSISVGEQWVRRSLDGLWEAQQRAA